MKFKSSFDEVYLNAVIFFDEEYLYAVNFFDEVSYIL